jgi:hypothetical protein
VSIIREAGIEVHSWAVNDASSLVMIQELGIPKFDTDELRLALEFREGL